jgi:prepilin-type N-terminal cleavage/methylation domain-containing protein
MNNQKGLTLIESLIALAILGFFVMLSAQITLRSQNVYFKNSEMTAVDDSLMRSEYYLRRFFTYAVGDNTLENPADLTSLPIGLKIIKSGIPAMNEFLDTVDDTSGANSLAGLNAGSDVDTIAYWVREEGNKAADGVSDFKRTALFYMKPTALKSGVLFFDSGADTVLTADYSRIFVDRLVDFSADVVFQPSTGRASSLRFNVTVRYFINTPAENYRWCPESLMATDASCTPTSGPFTYRDISKEVLVTLRNHVIGLSRQNPTYFDGTNTRANYERAFGSLYFFPPLVPENPL